jgi:hypothetical protein
MRDRRRWPFSYQYAKCRLRLSLFSASSFRARQMPLRGTYCVRVVTVLYVLPLSVLPEAP